MYGCLWRRLKKIMDELIKKRIDEMSYEIMLLNWRFFKPGNKMFQGETGEYYQKVMKEKEASLEPGEKSKISKEIGW